MEVLIEQDCALILLKLSDGDTEINCATLSTLVYTWHFHNT